VSLWFWGWVITAVGIAVGSAIARDRASAPFAISAGIAAVIAAFGGPAAWQWIAFAGVGAIVFVIVARPRYTPRHTSAAQRPEPHRHRARR
jgi:membrane protein implicated in regulation of membrane protease activity